MKLNKKVLAVTAILAVGILAGCGSSNSTAGSAASAPASGVESSAASSEAAGEMGDVLPIDAGDLNEIKTVPTSLQPASPRWPTARRP